MSLAGPLPAPRHDRRRRPRRSHRLHRRPLSLGLAAVATAAGAFAVVNVVSPDGHSDVTPASAATILARAQTALTPGPGQALEVTITDSLGSSTQMAMDQSSPQNWSQRVTGADGVTHLVDGQEDGMREFYDARENIIYRDTDTSDAVGLSAGDQALLDEVDAPGAHVTTNEHASLDGQAATSMTSTQDGVVYELWVDPNHGDRPLQFTETPAAGPPQTTTWADYASVTPSASTPSPAQLTALYPSATITTLDHAQFVAAETADGATGAGVGTHDATAAGNTGNTGS